MKPHYSQTFYRAFWFKAGVTLARLLGVKGARLVSRALAEMYRLTHPGAQAAVRENLALLCGLELREETVRRTFHNFGATLADYFQLGARGKPHALALIESRRGFENIQGALADGKGALLVTVHTGLFELGVLMEEFKLPLVVLSLPEPSAALNHWRAEYRPELGCGNPGDRQGPIQFRRHLPQARGGQLRGDAHGPAAGQWRRGVRGFSAWPRAIFNRARVA